MAGFFAVIPARGGSKGIPRKNLQPLGGVPLVSWAIRAAKGCQGLDRVVLSTDDQEIAELGHQEGAEVLMRPPELAQDQSTTLSLLQYLIEQWRQQDAAPTSIVLLEPTSPFRTPEIIEQCLSLRREKGTVVTVTQLERNPRNIFAVEGDRAEFFIKKPEIRFRRRQEFTHLKRLNGCVYVMDSDAIMAGQLLQEPIRVVEMSAEASANIDTPLDLKMARLFLEQLHQEGQHFSGILNSEHQSTDERG